MTGCESFLRSFLGIAAIAHNHSVIFGPKLSQRHRFTYFFEKTIFILQAASVIISPAEAR